MSEAKEEKTESKEKEQKQKVKWKNIYRIERFKEGQYKYLGLEANDVGNIFFVINDGDKRTIFKLEDGEIAILNEILGEYLKKKIKRIIGGIKKNE